MARSLVRLPPHVRQPFEVYLNGVHQHEGADYRVDGATLVFDRELKKDKISGWRWFLGAWGVGTYRQNDSVDVRFAVDGRPHVAEGLDIEPPSTSNLYAMGGLETSPGVCLIIARRSCTPPTQER
jgi:hypothetical protein